MRQGRLSRGLALAAALAAWLGASPPAGAQEPGETAGAQEPGAVIVRFASDADRSERAAARRAAGAQFEQALALPGLQLVDPGPGVSTREAVARLERSEDVLYAEPDVLRAATVRPNDSFFGSQWGLHKIGMQTAWGIGTGSLSTGVGVLDSGIELGHRDLASNIWHNPGEVGGGRQTNGRDDDGNGLVDDWRGWDFVEGDNMPGDANGHGTHVAGTVGARGNDAQGVTGVAWRVGLASLRVLDAKGVGRISSSVAAYLYAARAGLPVVNASLAGNDFSQAEYDAIKAASNTLVVVSAGNAGSNNDATGTYPCNHPLPNVICVAASDQDDALAGFSSFGRRSVDLAAPGVKILSTRPSGAYGQMSGTSMAAPHVAGTAALMRTLWPDASVAAVRASLLASVDARSALAGRTLTGGRLNAARSLSAPPSEAAFPADDGVDPARSPALAAERPAAPRDAAPPVVSARLLRRPRLRTALRRGVHVRVRCSEACRFRLALKFARVRVVGRGQGRLGAAGARVIRLKMSRRARRLLRKRNGRVLTLKGRASDRAGNRATLRRPVRLRR